MMLPAVTASPAYALIPSRCEVESRPLRTEPCPFLCAIATTPTNSQSPPVRQVGFSAPGCLRGMIAIFPAASALGAALWRGRHFDAGRAVDPRLALVLDRAGVLDAGVGPAEEVQLQGLTPHRPVRVLRVAVGQAADEDAEAREVGHALDHVREDGHSGD